MAGGKAHTDRSQQPPTALSREIGLGVMTLYAIGVMIGGGIYVLIGEVAGLAGYWTPAAFAIAGLAASLTAASFAELSARHPEAGGSATYVLHGFNSNELSLVVGLAVALTGLLSASAVLQGGVGYLGAFMEAPAFALIFGVGLFLTLLAAWGAAESLTFAAGLAVIEIIGLLIVVFVAFYFQPGGEAGVGLASQSLPLNSAPVNSAPVNSAPVSSAPAISAAAMTGAVVLAFFAFIGFEDVVNMAEEVRNPSRTMPLALMIAFIAVTLTYGLVSVAALRTVPPSILQESSRPLALVYEKATGGDASSIALVGVAAALNGVLAQIVMSARMLFSLGRRTPALSFFGVAHRKLKTPLRATIFAGVIVIILAVNFRLDGLASATSLILLAIFVLINIALIRVKSAEPAAPLRLPRAVPVAGAILSALMLGGALLR